MINSGKCPQCGRIITSVTLEDVDVSIGGEPKWRGITYSCQHCHCVMSAGIDPLTLKTEIVREVTQYLRAFLPK